MNDLFDCPWYHGKLKNNDLLKLFKKHGDFLVRQSLHQSNQFTLSVYFNNKLHHFRINQLSSEYLFDNQSIRFKSIKELIEYYLNNSIEITKLSGCYIKSPILRQSSSSSNISILITSNEDENNNNNNESSSYYELFTPPPPTLNESKKAIFLNTNTLIGFKNRNLLSSSKENVADEGKKFQLDSGNSKPVLNPPPKPVRIPTIKSKEKPESLKNMINSLKKVKNLDKEDDDYSNEYERIKEEKRVKFSYLGVPPKLSIPAIPIEFNRSADIRMPILSSFRTIFNLKNYKCDELIDDQSKRLDRHALNEINKMLIYTDDDPSSLAFNLAKCMTYEDIQLLRYNFDFGLGLNNGIELLCLLHGNFIRIDIIDRHKTFKLFICLLISLCQTTVDLRIKFIILWIDCAFYLFEKLKNLYAFSYVMEALNNEKIKRLTKTWSELKEKSEIKFNLFNRLNEHFEKLNRGDYYLIEKEALIPNIYPISLLLCENIDLNSTTNANELLTDYNKSKWLFDVFLATNARNILQNSNDYLKRSEKFLDEHYAPLFSFKYSKSESRDDAKHLTLLKMNYLVQSEFHKIILWSSDTRNYINDRKSSNIQMTSDDNLALVEINSRINDINTIISILSSKIQIS